MSIGRIYSGVIFTVLFAFVSSSAFAHTNQTEEQVRQTLLVEANWLAERLGTPGTVIVDARSPEKYQQGHIAGAINLPSTSTYHARLKHRVINQAEIQDMLGNRGINNDDHVIVYGNDLYKDAARVFWVLELYGHTHVSVMNGGYPAWRNEGLPIDTDIPVPVPVSYRAVTRPGRMTTKLQMLLAIDTPDIVIVDTRDAIEYQGIKSRANRSGHIPMAINIPKNRSLEVRQGGSYIKSRAGLEQSYQALDGFSRIILYCNGGQGATFVYLALRHLGKKVSIYDGGWKEWGNNPALPVVTPAQ